jgi:hypothetical protein
MAIPKQSLSALWRYRLVDRRMAESVFEWYKDSGEEDCLGSEPYLDRVGYAFEIDWQMKELDEE